MTRAIIYMREMVIFFALGDAPHPEGQAPRKR